MKKAFLLFCLGLFLSVPSLAQDQKSQLAQALRSDGSPLEAAILMHMVELDMDPGWWELMLDPGDSKSARLELRIFLTGIRDLGTHMRLGELAELDDDTGRKANSPPVLAMLKAWQEKIKVKVNIKFKPDDATTKNTVNGLDRMAYPIGTVAKPRSGTMDLTVTFDPQSTKMTGTASPDGGTYSFKLPVYSSWSQSKVDAIMKRGH